MPERRALCHGLLALLLAVPLSGCLSSQQVSAVRRFSSATAAVGDAASSEFVRMRNETIEMNTTRLALGGPVADLPGPGNLDESFDPEAVIVRVTAAQTLKTYGELLLSLATDTQGAELRAAADQFRSSVAALAPAEKKLDEDQLDAIGTAVETAGGLVVEYRKSKAIRRIVRESGPQVSHLCELLERDLDPGQARLATGFKLTAGELKIAADDVLDAGPSASQREAAMSAFQLAQTNETHADQVLASASRSIGKLRAAQTDLEQALEDRKPRIRDITAFAAEARKLFDALKIFAGEG